MPSAITMSSGKLNVPNDPILPFLEGDGTGPDIWKASTVRVMDAAVSKASTGGKKKIVWFEVLAGEKAFNKTGNWLPDDTVTAFQDYLVGIKGPLTTPIGGGIRSLNVAASASSWTCTSACASPVRWFRACSQPGQEAGRLRHGHLPRERRGHLRRHRVEEARSTPEAQEDARLHRQGVHQGTSPRSASARARRRAMDYFAAAMTQNGQDQGPPAAHGRRHSASSR